MKVRRILAIVASATFVAALAACGGGGDGNGLFDDTTTAAAIGKYVGTWRSCVQVGTNSELETLTITKTGDTTGTFSSTQTTHASADCSGAATGTVTESGSLTWVGTKTVGTETVDKLDLAMGTETQKQIAVVRADGTFHTGIPVGDTGSSPDAEGYPGALDPNWYTKATTPTTPTTPTAGSLDKYVGTWTVCWPSTTTSEAEVLTITRTSDTTGNFNSTLTMHSGAGCTGTVLGTESGSGSLTWKGTKTVGSETVDKIEIVMGTQTEKQIVLVRPDGKLYSGIETADPGSNPDAEGYPSVIETPGMTRL